MKIQAVASPADIKQPTTNNSAKRTAAIEAFKGASTQGNQQPQTQVVQNQSQVSVEEMGAIVPKPNVTEEASQVLETIEEAVEAAAPVETPKVDEAADKVSRQFAQLARQEKALRAKAQQQEQAIKAREQALAAREAELSAKDTQYSSGYISQERLKSDTLRTLAEAGIPLDDFMQQLVTQTQNPVDPRTEAMISRLESKIKSLEQAAETSQKTWAEQQSQAYQQAVKQIETDAMHLVKTDPNFETIKATGNVREIVNLIKETHAKDGILLTVEEAAQQVEDYLVEEAMKVTQIDKIKKRLAAASTPAAKPNTESKPVQKQVQQQPMKTLTNATSSSRQLSARERALLAFKGELK